MTVNGEAVEPSDSYMFENVSADAALHVEFAKIGAAPSGDVFRITLQTGEGGAAALDGAPEVEEGGAAASSRSRPRTATGLRG